MNADERLKSKKCMVSPTCLLTPKFSEISCTKTIVSHPPTPEFGHCIQCSPVLNIILPNMEFCTHED